MKFAKLNIIIVVLVFSVCIIANSIIPLRAGKMKSIKDENGMIIPGSISEKVWIKAEGTELGLIVKSVNPANPVLLLLGGGPGIPEYFLETRYGSNLEKYFTVCYYSYRGTGLSYDCNITRDDLTTENYLNDTLLVATYLKERFGQEKIYLMGHSFGTYIGLNMAKNHPELFKAYIGMSQITDQNESELLAYNYMCDYFAGNGNKKMSSALAEYKSLFEIKQKLDFSNPLTTAYFAKVRDAAMHQAGVGTVRTMKSVITGIFFPSLRMKEFTIKERIDFWKGKALTNGAPVCSDSFNYNSFEAVKKIEVPFYVFAGLYDYTTAYPLQKKYFDEIEAPEKKFYVFENSAHSPLFEENEKALQILREDLLIKGTI